MKDVTAYLPILHVFVGLTEVA